MGSQGNGRKAAHILIDFDLDGVGTSRTHTPDSEPEDVTEDPGGREQMQASPLPHAKS